MNLTRKKQSGFTLLEVLLVVGIISILAAITIVAINPSKQLGDARNSERRSDVNSILNAIYQAKIDGATLTIPNTATEICDTTGATCSGAGLVDLGVLIANGKYLVSIPKDPSSPATPNTKYRIVQDVTSSRVTVDAMVTDNSVTITATK